MTLPAGYCTNVHAGATLSATRANLERYALPIKSHFRPEHTIGVGLWLSQAAAQTMIATNQLLDWRAWLSQSGLVPFTMNAFPHGDFHAEQVMHRVYHPTWSEPARGDYTRSIIHILDRLLPSGIAGTISTLPIAWGKDWHDQTMLNAAAKQLVDIADFLQQLEATNGRHIRLCLEPEPGCLLDCAADVVRFFHEYLHSETNANVQRYLGVCHDVCHSAVMFEPQAEAILTYHNAGIIIGKVQVSAAVSMRGEAGIAQLREFAEPRYLHQTMKLHADGTTTFFENLPDALADTTPAEEWRTHFHVPIYLTEFGQLQTTQPAIVECLTTLQQLKLEPHFEVETYAWGVLPSALHTDLARGIANELAWLEQQRRLFMP